MKKLTTLSVITGCMLSLGGFAQETDGEGGKKGNVFGGANTIVIDGNSMKGGNIMAEVSKRMTELSKNADADGDGKISQEERKALFKNMRESWKKRNDEFVKKWDKNGDGKVDGNERKAMSLSRTDEEFAKIDTNDDKSISLEEFRAFKDNQRNSMRNMWRDLRGNGNGTQAQTKATIERFDENGDGQVDDSERLKAAQATLERMEKKGLSGEWKRFDKDGNGTLNQAEKDALVLEIADRLKKKLGAAEKKDEKVPETK